MNLIATIRRKLHTAGKIGSQFSSTLKDEGFAAAIAFCMAKAAAIVREKRMGSRIAGAHVSADFDKQFGVDTGGLKSMSAMKIDSPNFLYGTVYKASDPARVREMIAAPHVAFPEFTFIDLGSGKGLTLLMASDYPFRRILGVEFALELHATAEANIRNYRSQRQKCRNIRSVCADAAQFEFPNEPLFVYMYHPFEEHLMTRVLARIEQSYRANPRPMVIAYLQPALRKLFDGQTFLKPMAESPMTEMEGRTVAAYVIYATSEVAVTAL